jgi:soluble lytic murein transglycosylase-like protein
LTFRHLLTRLPGAAKRLPARALTGAVVVLAASAVPASAQIYTWRDANGNLVLSDQRPSSETAARTFAVPKAPDVRATRAVAMRHWNTYEDLIAEHARIQGIRPDLVRAVVQVESAFNPYARSAKGALGLMQLMPATIRQYGVKNPFDPAENVRAGVAYLRGLLDRYHDNEELALAAYNAGPGAVDKHGQSIPPYRETRNYVAQINRMTARPVQKRGNAIYKGSDTIEGREIPLYTDRKPTAGGYEVVGAR